MSDPVATDVGVFDGLGADGPEVDVAPGARG